MVIPPNILVVEDDRFLSKAYQAKLSKEGLAVTAALDGEEAIKAVSQAVPDVILLDLMLPKKNGFEVLEAIRKDARLAAVPVIILSNLGQDSDIERGKALGAVDYLVKTNVKLDGVLQKIKQYLPK